MFGRYDLGRGAGFVQSFAWLGEFDLLEAVSVTRMATLSPLRVSIAMIWLLSKLGLMSASLRVK